MFCIRIRFLWLQPKIWIRSDFRIHPFSLYPPNRNLNNFYSSGKFIIKKMVDWKKPTEIKIFFTAPLYDDLIGFNVAHCSFFLADKSDRILILCYYCALRRAWFLFKLQWVICTMIYNKKTIIIFLIQFVNPDFTLLWQKRVWHCRILFL